MAKSTAWLILRQRRSFHASCGRRITAHVIAAGVSTGGFATVALTAQAPPGLVAAISFAGGRGSNADFAICNPADLFDAFRDFGKHSRTPMLWVYAENDRYFWPALACCLLLLEFRLVLLRAPEAGVVLFVKEGQP